MPKKLPLYELFINEKDDTIVNKVSLVDSPAIESNFLSFSTVEHFATSEEKRELIGVAMIPNQKIYRRVGDNEYEVFFSENTIRQIAQVFMKKGLQGETNLFHSEADGGCYIYQSFITDEGLGIKAPEKLGTIPNGSWIIGVKVTSEDVWKQIKAGELKGFSVEGIFNLFPTDVDFSSMGDKEETTLDLMKQLLKQLNNN